VKMRLEGSTVGILFQRNVNAITAGFSSSFFHLFKHLDTSQNSLIQEEKSSSAYGAKVK
jgi:hypothetical protein